MTPRLGKLIEKINGKEQSINTLIDKMPNTIETYIYLEENYLDRYAARQKQVEILSKILNEIQAKYGLNKYQLREMAEIAKRKEIREIDELNDDINDIDCDMNDIDW